MDEVLPGDTFNMNATFFGRLATPLKPLLDNLYLETMWFFVPNRLTWESWEKFNGAQDNPGDSTDYVVPQVNSFAGWTENSLGDYFGLPTQVPGLDTNVLPLRAYNLIWNEWFRDENLQDSVVVDTGDAEDDPADYVLLKRGKRKDYFTSCLPWPQKGPAVDLPLGTSAPVDLSAMTIVGDGSSPSFDGSANDPQAIGNLQHTTNAGSGNLGLEMTTTGSVTTSGDALWDDPHLDIGGTATATLSAATAATINQLRQAFQIQKLYERDARGGTRYTEILRSHFGVISPDQRLQRPEYLGGGTTAITVNPVSAQGAPTALGQLGAYTTTENVPVSITKSFTEHCIVIGLVASRADLNYQQGLNRMFSRSERWDFYWPALAHIGEQAVLNKEIYAQGDGDTNDNQVFGYQERYAEYRYKPSIVTGEMRSSAAASLDVWHLAQDFSALPVLNDTFIQENPPLNRVLLVDGDTQFLLDTYTAYKHARPMPTYSVPGLIDHF